MSTNNNHSSRSSKDVLPKWLKTTNSEQSMPKISGDKLNRMMSNLSDITALSLSNRDCSQIIDLKGLSKLRRLDISENKLKRLAGMLSLTDLGMLNVSKNDLQGSQSLEELRYLPELRTLNIGYNPKILHLESHIVKGKLTKLQALICNECGFKSVSFLKFCTNLNTLILSSNSLTVFPTSNDFSLSGLTKLSLSKNNLKQIPNLSVCVNLQELRINNNEITSLSDTITMAPKLKILEISNNLIDSWESVEFLLKLQYLTNLSLAGNPLPPPPATYDHTPLREDISGGRIDDPATKRYRHHVLSMFQIKVGSEDKDKVRLIVLDSKRVKMKWSHTVNPDNEQLDDAVDLQDIGVTGSSAVPGAGPGASSHRLPKKNQSRLSRSGKLKEDGDEKIGKKAVSVVEESAARKKSSKRKKEEEVSLSHEEGTIGVGDEVEEKETATAKKKRKRAARDAEVAAASEQRGDAQFSRDSGVVGVEVMSGAEQQHKQKKKAAASVDLSLLSGGDGVKFGAGGSSAWD